MSNISELSTTAASNNSAPPDGAPEGWLPSKVNDTLRELMAALAKWYQDARGSLTTAGTGNAYTLTTNNVFTALTDVPIMAFYCDRANTGAITLNIDGLGAKSVYKVAPLQDFVSGEVKAGMMMVVVYNPTEDYFECVSNVGAIAPKGHIFGLTLSNGTDTLHDIDIATGQAVDSTGVDLMVLGSGLTKQLDNTWAVGSAAGGLDTGTIAASTTYHMFLIKRSDTGNVDVLFSTSASAPTMPTNYDLKRRIGSIVTDSSSQILQFSQLGDEFLWDAEQADFNAALGTAETARTLTVPTGIQVWARMGVLATDNDAASVVSIYSKDQTSIGNISHVAVPGNLGSAYGSSDVTVRTDTSGQVYTKASSSVDNVQLRTYGWIDRRGKDA